MGDKTGLSHAVYLGKTLCGIEIGENVRSRVLGQLAEGGSEMTCSMRFGDDLGKEFWKTHGIEFGKNSGECFFGRTCGGGF